MNELQHVVRCAIYTRKSTEQGLEQEFNTLQAQREAAEAYTSVKSRTAGTHWLTATTMVVQRSQPGAACAPRIARRHSSP
jgi:hypothetical protein